MNCLRLPQDLGSGLGNRGPGQAREWGWWDGVPGLSPEKLAKSAQSSAMSEVKVTSVSRTMTRARSRGRAPGSTSFINP